MPSIFLSHSHEDKSFVRELATKLQLFGIKAWVDEMEILAGDSLIGKIESGLQASDYLGAVLSPRSISLEWVTREICAALSGEAAYKRVIVLPMIIEDCNIPPFLQDKLYADFRSEFFVGFSTILRRLLGNNFFEKATLDDIHTWAEKHKVTDPMEKFRSYVKEQTEIREIQFELERFRQTIITMPYKALATYLTSLNEEEKVKYVFRLAESFHHEIIRCARCRDPMISFHGLGRFASRCITPIVTIDRHVRLPLSQGRGHRVGFCSWLMREVVIQVKTYRTLSS